MHAPLDKPFRITSKFGATGHGRKKPHSGLDLVSTASRNVYAPLAGTAKLRWDKVSGYGVDLWLSGNTKLEFIHMFKNGRVAGKVKEGQLIGKWSDSGTGAASPHCHIGYQIGAKQYDPEKFLASVLHPPTPPKVTVSPPPKPNPPTVSTPPKVYVSPVYVDPPKVTVVPNSETKVEEKKMKVDFKDILVRSAKTFGQAFISVVMVTDLEVDKQLIFSGVVAGVSGVWNIILVPLYKQIVK